MITTPEVIDWHDITTTPAPEESHVQICCSWDADKQITCVQGGRLTGGKWFDDRGIPLSKGWTVLSWARDLKGPK